MSVYYAHTMHNPAFFTLSCYECSKLMLAFLVVLHMVILVVYNTRSLGYNSIGDAGAQALGEVLKYCTNIQQLE